MQKKVNNLEIIVINFNIRYIIKYTYKNMSNICNICEYKFSTKYSLNRHLNNSKKCKKPDEINSYICDVCEKIFKSKTGLDYHKNKKNPCKPIIETLREENERLHQQIIQTNSNNTSTNSNNTTTNNNQKTKNIQYNIYINSNELAEIKDNLNSFNYKQIEDILKHVNIENNEQIQLLNVNKDHCKDFILDNTEEISDLFKILYANFKYLPCILFRLDELNFEEIYVKDDINTLNKLDNSKLLYIIYETFNVLINNYSEFINKKLKCYYRNFIIEYNSGLFTDLKKPHVKKFITDIKNKLRDHIMELYEDLKLLYKKDLKKLNDKNNKFTGYLKIKNQESIENSIIYPKKQIKKDDLKNINNILDRLKSYGNQLKIARFGNIDFEEYPVLTLLEFFLNDYYFKNNEFASVKLEKGILYEFILDKWDVVDFDKFSKKNIHSIDIELRNRNINFDYNNNVFIISNESFDFCDAVDNTNIYILEMLFKHLFKYHIFEPYNKIEKSIITY